MAFARLDAGGPRLDQPALREVDKIAEGRNFRATDARSLEELYATINELEKTKIEEQIYTNYAELYPYALLPALALLMLELLLVNTRLRRLP